MDSSAIHRHRAQNVPKECDTTYPVTRHASGRRTLSYSSSSSFSSCSSSYFLDDLPLSPASPFRFSGVPFSWERLPGVPKKQIHKKKDTTLNVLPLPPLVTPPTSKRITFQQIETRKENPNESLKRDPFLAALVQCSKDDNDDHDQESLGNLWSGPKVSRSISDRFGFINLYTSCKRSCSVSESIVCLPRSTKTSL